MDQLVLAAPQPARIEANLERLSQFCDPDLPGWTRQSFTRRYREAREWLAETMSGAGLSVRLDASANLIGRLGGTGSGLPPIVVGSHTDTVRSGGRFDGIVGVLAGVELARCLRESRLQLRHPLEIVDFLAEEPSVFGLSVIGSRTMAGALLPEHLKLSDETGRTLADAIGEMGGDPRRLASAMRNAGDVVLYLELHIEQGPILENARDLAATLECLAAPREGSVDLLTQLAGAGVGLGLISDCSSEVPAVWARSPLAAHIHHPVFSAAVGLKKPDPRIFALACERLGVPPDRTLYVGDGGSEELPGACAVGMRAVLFTPGDTTEPRWDGPRIRSLSEVAVLLDRADDDLASVNYGRMARSTDVTKGRHATVIAATISVREH